ncbi:MAG: START domain-containing protein [Opitutales bacterium]|nr:START domain-containing protein [Opitutales bacterium]
MILYFRLCPFFFLLVSSLGLWGEQSGGWKKINQTRGIEVYEKKVGQHLAFRGIATLEGTTEKLLGILHNPESWKNWVNHLKSGKLLEKKSDFHWVFRQVIATPFPMKDREVVYQSIVSRTHPKTVRVEMKSINHPQVPRSKDWIRTEIVFTRYLVKQYTPNQMRVTFENLSKPGGDVPEFLTNWASRSYPISILEGIQKELFKKEQKTAPLP